MLLVDDFTGEEDNVEKVYLLFMKLKLRFLEGRFDLRKCRTNDKDLRELFRDSMVIVTALLKLQMFRGSNGMKSVLFTSLI